MSDTKTPLSEGSNGSQKTWVELEPWEIAVMSVAEGITVEFATDEQFQAYVTFNKIPVRESDIAGWSFVDRCGVINFARLMRIDLKPVPNKNNSEIEGKSELFEGNKGDSEGS